MPTLKQLRKERGIHVNISQILLGYRNLINWYIENGERRVYHDLIVKIARILEVDLKDIEI